MRRTLRRENAVATPTDGTELVIDTIYAPLGSNGGGVPIGLILATNVAVTFGSGATSATVRIRRGTIAGTVIASGTVSSTGASTGHVSGADFSPTGGAYVLTVQQGGSPTAAGAVTGFFYCDQ